MLFFPFLDKDKLSLSCLIIGLYSIKLNFGAVKSVKLSLQNKGGVSGRLGYFAWEVFVFQA